MNDEAESEKARNKASASDTSGDAITTRACPACGSTAQRKDARFCATCGRRLNDEGYVAADAVRASYHLHRRSSASSSSDERIRPAHKNRSPKSHAATLRVMRSSPPALFVTTRNSAAATALAFLTFAIVPYLGILFCPGAIVMGIIGFWTSARAPALGGRSASVFSIIAGLVVCAVHIFLWWILYFIYALNRL